MQTLGEQDFDEQQVDEVVLDPSKPDQTVKIGAALSPDVRQQIIDFLKANADCFAWSHEDVTGIDPDVITHRLNVDPNHKPVKQKRRKFAPERNQIINDEVQKLIDTGKVREVKYPDWLANVVVVGKKNGKWRVCIDFTDLNKACPKDSFPLPHIDALVDATAGHELLSFMDAFSGYNQILMHPEDQEKTSFITDRGIYCYKVMPFGLKNAGATYQRLVNAMFKDQLGDTMEVYIDDMLVKSKNSHDHVSHLQQSFDVIRRYGMKLNPTKCSFGVSAGKFLGYIVTKRGIEASPDQIKAILNIQSPRNVKEIQKLTGRVAALNRFISKSSDMCRLLYDVLKKNKGFNWTPEHEQALQDLKQYLMTPPLLSKPIADEPLQLYVAVSESSVSAVLAREGQDGRLPVYYVSKSLVDAETRYSSLEKFVLAIVTASKKLKHYFEAHSICVKTNYPVKSILRHPELTGRMSKWAITLSSYDITYQPRTAIKSQALADFVADFSPTLEAIAQTEVSMLEVNTTNSKWILHVDGSSNFRGAGLGVLLKSPQGDIIARAISCDFKATNNEAEYEALLAGLTLSKDLKATEVEAYSDSLLIVSQIKGEFAAKDSKMTAYLNAVQSKVKSFGKFDIFQIPRDQNTQADALANIGSAMRKSEFKGIPIVHLSSPAVHKATTVDDVNNIATDVNDIDVSNAAAASTSWQTPFIQYLKDGTLPEDRLQARKVRFRASMYVLLDGILFRKSIAGPYLRCLDGDECRQVLQEMHDRCCGNHSGGRSLSNRTSCMGYYWPTLRRDAVEYAKKCDACQRHAAMSHQPAEKLHPTITP
ncbi:uncharacterized protein LOC104892696 [Beta vulgaris subsp. vulgaris]|uniref:uncharacterized protein LOC104892696 n=1 Tax=Beta vulgaris subsp. vulgaris TaxID=3555 RepID=UPI0005403705|nr:uncharacterized protein LOC104892696 [Beta vulgaris subsp. vulgaris]